MRMPTPSAPQDRRGVSLLEVVVAVGIFAAATVVTSTFIFQGYTANRYALEMSDAIEHARVGIAAMAKEVREARFAENGDYPIVLADTQSFTFYSDLDSDAALERVRYFLSGTNLQKGVIEPVGSPATYPAGSEVVTTVSQYVRNAAEPVFTYYAGSYPTVTIPLTTPATPISVRLLILHLKINIDPFTAPGDFTLDQAIHLRNLKDNL